MEVIIRTDNLKQWSYCHLIVLFKRYSVREFNTAFNNSFIKYKWILGMMIINYHTFEMR